MRIGIQLVFALSVILSVQSGAIAQEGFQEFTWRKAPASEVRQDEQSKEQLDGKHRKLSAMARLLRQVSYQEPSPSVLGDNQPSVSDVVRPQVPSPPGADEAPLVEIPAAPAIEAEKPESTEPNYCERDCKCFRCCLGCERKLFGENCNGLSIGGWTNIGYHNRETIMLNNRKGEANVHQVWMYIDKEADQGGLGYHFDLLYGIDGQDLQAFGNAPTGNPSGWDNGWDYGSYGWALPQAYLTMNRNCWDIKAGKFFSPFGYEVIAAPENFFYSRSYTMYYMEPFTMSGVLAEKQVNACTSTLVGVTAGWDTAFDNNDHGFTLITGLRHQPNQYVNLALTSSLGDTGYRNSGTLNTFVAEMQLTESVDYVAQLDFLNLGSNDEFGLVQYLFREISPCLGLGARLEWWKSDQLFNSSRSTYEFTAGANWRPNANVTFRPEVRWDWGAAAIDPGATIIGVDAVITF